MSYIELYRVVVLPVTKDWNTIAGALFFQSVKIGYVSVVVAAKRDCLSALHVTEPVRKLISG
jgi:hypothetical protein